MGIDEVAARTQPWLRIDRRFTPPQHLYHSVFRLANLLHRRQTVDGSVTRRSQAGQVAESRR
ncbi:MAG: hypothetical protein ACYDB7_06970, partial [Mycobacteriales bacterium]